MKRLLIIGAGSFGREVLEYAEDIVIAGIQEWTIGGFIDDNIHALDGYDVNYPIVGRIEDYIPQTDDVFISAFGEGKQRVRYAEIIRLRGGIFTNIIHPQAKLLHRVSIGIGSIIGMNTLIANDTICGDFLYMNYGSIVGHDNVLGIGCTLNVYSGTNGCCTIGDYVYMGTHAVVIPGKKIGNNVNIAAGAVVFNNVKASVIIYGNPAKIL
jgi:sugar O-acyltransferase (sialic acid O-acetyltransferase NeuD family)